MEKPDIIVVDQTLREGMQFRGLMFSRDERKQILEFQEKLGIDISQAAYPPSHPSEVAHIKDLHRMARERGWAVRVAGLCRAKPDDVKWMLDLGLKDFHLHSGINTEMLNRFGLAGIFSDLANTVNLIRSKVPDAFIIVAFADVGTTDPDLLDQCVDFAADTLRVDGINLPDTSGRLSPNVYHDMIKRIAERIRDAQTRIAVHCHNDFGMASANTFMGVLAGASVIEATALGIGERNGIADLYVVCRMLKDQGIPIRVKCEDVDIFKAYYDYVNDICIRQTGFAPLDYNTPVFGDAIKTHVAGTHGIIHYSTSDEKKYFLNVLCGKHLVESYLKHNGIDHNPAKIRRIVDRIKNKSVETGRPVTREDVVLIAGESGDPFMLV